jgi:hypothetical protein
MSQGSSGSHTVEKQSKLDPDVKKYQKYLFDQSRGVLDSNYQNYEPQRFAGMSSDTSNAMSAVRGLQGGTTQGFQNAQNVAGGAGGYTPQQAQAQSFLGGPGIDQYQSPYQSAVIDQMRDRGFKNIARQGRQISADAEMQGAGTGSRAAVERGTMRAEGLSNLDAATAQYLDRSYSQAAGLKGSDIDRNLTQQQLNQAAGLQGSGLNLEASKVMGGLTGAQQAAGYKDAKSLAGVGAASEGYAQRQKDFDYDNWLDEQNWRQNKLSWGANLLGGMPQGQSSTQSSPMYRNQNAAGKALAGAGAGYMAAGGPANPWAWVGGAAGGLAGYMG